MRLFNFELLCSFYGLPPTLMPVTPLSQTLSFYPFLTTKTITITPSPPVVYHRPLKTF